MSEPVLSSVFHILLEGDETGWIQMLIFAVIIGLSAVSRLATQRKQKRQIEREQDSGRRPAQPAGRQIPGRTARQQPMQREPQQRPSAQRQPQPYPEVQSEPRPHPVAEDQPRRQAAGRPRPRTIIRPGSALSAFVAEIKQEIQRAADEMQGKTPPPPKAVPKPRPPTPPEVVEPSLEFEEPELPHIPTAGKKELVDVGLRLPALAGPEDLKTAILYYEILGKPLSIRPPAEHLIGL